MSLQVETYEALCSALYQLSFAEFLGEKDMPDGRTGWFHIGEHPKDIRVAFVLSPDREEVRVRIEWRNYSADARNPLKGEQVLVISTYAAGQGELEQATQNAVVRVLEVYKEVLTEEGVAGQISELVDDEPESEA